MNQNTDHDTQEKNDNSKLTVVSRNKIWRPIFFISLFFLALYVYLNFIGANTCGLQLIGCEAGAGNWYFIGIFLLFILNIIIFSVYFIKTKPIRIIYVTILLIVLCPTTIYLTILRTTREEIGVYDKCVTEQIPRMVQTKDNLLVKTGQREDSDTIADLVSKKSKYYELEPIISFDDKWFATYDDNNNFVVIFKSGDHKYASIGSKLSDILITQGGFTEDNRYFVFNIEYSTCIAGMDIPRENQKKLDQIGVFNLETSEIKIMSLVEFEQNMNTFFPTKSNCFNESELTSGGRLYFNRDSCPNYDSWLRKNK